MTSDILSAAQQFHEFLTSHGHPLDSSINHDSGTFHRYKCPNGHSTDAAYKFFSDGIPAGYLHCWKCQISEPFSSKKKDEVSHQEWQAHVLRMTECKLQNESETRQKHAEAAILAKAVFSIADEEKAPEHEYLCQKQVESYGLRIITSKNETTEKAKCYPGTLLIPCYNADDELCNLERIYFNQDSREFEKRPLTGAQRSGTFYQIGKITDPCGVILIGEGYSTMATTHEATGYPSVVSFNCGNLPHVIKIFRQKHPQALLCAISDNDKWNSNPELRDSGLKAAQKACTGITNSTYFLPDFSVLNLPENKLTELRPRATIKCCVRDVIH